MCNDSVNSKGRHGVHILQNTLNFVISGVVFYNTSAEPLFSSLKLWYSLFVDILIDVAVVVSKNSLTTPQEGGGGNVICWF